jgi:RimJ/RimL family protein N-acetyltransferase
MLIVGQNALVNDFVDSLDGGYCHPSLSQSFGWLTPKGLIGGIVFHNHLGQNISANIAIAGSHLPRGLLLAALAYGFVQLGCVRLTFFVTASNIKSIKFVTKLGAYREATLQDGCSDGDLYVYCLRPDRCNIWRKSVWARKVDPQLLLHPIPR